MKIEVNFSMFCDMFKSAGRGDQFSYKALRALFDHCEESDPGMELDVIALCCDFVETTIEDVRDENSECADMDDMAVLEWLRDNTFIVSGYPLVHQAF